MFQIILYYKKRIIIGGKTPSISSIIEIKKKLGINLDAEEYDKILDEYSDNSKNIGCEEIVSTWVIINEDDNFINEVKRIESDSDFIEWDKNSNEIIKQKILNK